MHGVTSTAIIDGIRVFVRVFAVAVADIGCCVKVETAVREGAGSDNAGSIAIGNIFAGDGALGDVGVIGVKGVAGSIDNAVAVPAVVHHSPCQDVVQ